MIAKVVIYRDQAGEWRLTAKAHNGEPIVSSSEGYKNRAWAIDVAEQVFPFVPLVDDTDSPIPAQPPHPDGAVQRLVAAAGALLNSELEPHEAFAELRQALEPFQG